MNDSSDASGLAGAKIPREIRLRVHAGPHSRRHCPVLLKLPVAVERVLLSRIGRLRPVVCQCKPEDDGTVLWWIVDSMRAGAAHDYVVHFDQRQRESLRRVRVKASPTGWLVRVRKRPCAEVLCPAEGVWKLTLLSGGVRRALVTHRAGRSESEHVRASENERLHRVRLGKPAVANGPVFASLAVDYRYVDAQARPVWTERATFRFFDGPEDCFSFDLAVEWRATSGAIEMGGESALSRTPILRVQLAGGEADRLAAASGKVGASEVDGAVEPFVAAVGDRSSLLIAVDGSGFGAPPTWRTRSGEVLELRPSFGPRFGSPAEVRIPLGGRIDSRCRLSLFQSTRPESFAWARSLDFEVPPKIEILDALSGG